MEDAPSDSSRYKASIGWLLCHPCWICIKTTFQKSTYFTVLPVINTTCSVKGKNRNKVQSLTSTFQFRRAVCQHHEKSIIEMTLVKNSEKVILGKTIICYFVLSMFSPFSWHQNVNSHWGSVDPLHIITLKYIKRQKSHRDHWGLTDGFFSSLVLVIVWEKNWANWMVHGTVI